MDERLPRLQPRHGSRTIQPTEKYRSIAVEVAIDLGASPTSGATRREQGVTKHPLRVGDALGLVGMREIESRVTARPPGNLPDCDLVEQQPRFRHPHGDDRYDGLADTGVRGAGPYLLAPVLNGLRLGIPMHERGVEPTVEAAHRPQPVCNRPGRGAKSRRVWRVDRDLQSTLEAQLPKVFGERQIGGTVGDEDGTDRHATSAVNIAI